MCILRITISPWHWQKQSLLVMMDVGHWSCLKGLNCSFCSNVLAGYLQQFNSQYCGFNAAYLPTIHLSCKWPPILTPTVLFNSTLAFQYEMRHQTVEILTMCINVYNSIPSITKMACSRKHFLFIDTSHLNMPVFYISSKPYSYAIA